ncbi:hypothetical protein KQI84_09440 [bacterium]|nr:hypothetical protein [bacterium]
MRSNLSSKLTPALLAAGAMLLSSAVTAQVQINGSGSYADITTALASASANDTITVDGSTYNGVTETVNIALAGITLEGINGAIVQNPGDGADTGTAGTGAVIRVSAVADVTIQNLNVVVDEPEAGGGIAFVGTAAQLGTCTITGNTITTTGPSASSSVSGIAPFGNAGYGSSVGISIYQASGGTPVNAVIQNNTVGSATNPFSIFGIIMERSTGTISGNTTYCENFSFINRFAYAPVNIDNNHFYGYGDERNRGAVVELGDVQTGGDVTFTNNTLETLDSVSQRSPQGFIPRRLMQIKNCYNSTEVQITGNTFNVRRDDTVAATEGASGTGLAITNVRRAFVGNNTFNALEDDCLLLEVNNKIYSSGQPFQNAGNETNRPRIYGNTFNATGTSGVTAISFRDHAQENAGSGVKIEIQDIVCGNSADPNKFGADLGTFIELSDLNTTTDNALDLYGNQAAESNLSVSTAIPFAKNFFASENQYDVGSGLQFPFQMDGAGLAAVEAKVQHYTDNNLLGLVVISRDPDADNDDVPDALEALLGTDGVASRDFDGDGIEDGVEIQIGSDPAVDEGPVDSDGDGLPDGFDPTNYAPGGVIGTDSDYDGDGFADWYEVLFGTNPEDPAQVPLLGDVDNAVAGVDFTDGIKMLRVFLGLDTLSALDNPALFDVNRDGVNDNVDGVITINYDLGNIQELPFGN